MDRNEPNTPAPGATGPAPASTRTNPEPDAGPGRAAHADGVTSHGTTSHGTTSHGMTDHGMTDHGMTGHDATGHDARADGAAPHGTQGHGGRTPVSDIILATARDWPLPRITLGELIAAFGMRSYGLLIVLFAIPNLLPVYIPGLSPIFGIPLAIIALQLALGYPMPKLPGILTRRSLKREDLQNIAVAAQPWLRRIEYFLKPRPSALTRRGGERILGGYMFFLALLVIVPLPFTNGPPSFACAIIAIGLIEEDTLTIVAGLVVGVLGTVLALSVMGGFYYLLAAGWQFMFGG